ncbi:MAG TPA: DUF1028 domain-containing protein [Rhodothermales bacterium]
MATYSIVARDSISGELGVAVQSHWYSVGPIVPWAEAGIGAVATQSLVDPAYGPLGLDMMRMGKSAPEALNGLLASDPHPEVRQVAMIDASGRVAAHTGNAAIQAAGHLTGAQFSVQANLMERETVWQAMAVAYRTAEGDLADRLIAALEAAEAEGGDIRGKQSAAILVVSGKSSGRPWVDRLFDLRVEDHPEPVKELKRLVRLQRAYLKMNEGDERMSRGDLEEALLSYQEALAIVPDSATNGEVAFWVGAALASVGREREAIPYLRRAYHEDDRWAETLRRLSPAGILPQDPALIERLVEGMMNE